MPSGVVVSGDRRGGLDAAHHVRCRSAAVVHQVDRFEVGLRRRHQCESVGYRSGHRVLVRQDDPVRGVAQLDRAYQAARDGAVGGPHLVHVDRRLRVGRPEAGLDPTLESFGRLDVGVLSLRCPREDHGDGVVRVLVEQVGALGVVDHVVRRAQQARESRAVHRGAQRPKRAAGPGAVAELSVTARDRTH